MDRIKSTAVGRIQCLATRPRAIEDESEVFTAQ